LSKGHILSTGNCLADANSNQAASEAAAAQRADPTVFLAAQRAAASSSADEPSGEVAPTRRPSRAFSVGKSPEADGLERICSAMAMEPEDDSAHDELAAAPDLPMHQAARCMAAGPVHAGGSIGADGVAAGGAAAGACLPRGATIFLAQVHLSRKDTTGAEDSLPPAGEGRVRGGSSSRWAC
jgi:hypothetical protein